MSKVAIDNLANEIQSILSEYGESATEVMQEAMDGVLQEGVRDLKSTSPKKTGDYAKGWAKQKTTSRLGVSGVIYNKTKPQLTHLLENGHANRNGGRTPGKAHIEPVNDDVQAEYIKEVTTRLEKGI